MFEHDQQVVNSLLNENKNFRRLYDKHSLLKRAVQEANQGHSNAEGLSLEELLNNQLANNEVYIWAGMTTGAK